MADDNSKVTAASQADDAAAQEKQRKADEASTAKAAAAAEKRDAELDAPAEFAPAETLAASGAMIEEGAVAEVDFDHPAVDNNPRSGTNVRQNSIDFNDPSLSVEEAVAANLDAQQG